MATISVSGLYVAFVCSAASASAGAIYTNNGGNFTIKVTASGALLVYALAASVLPAASGTLIKSSGTGDATIAFSAHRLDAHIDGIGMVANDIVNVSGGQRLIIDKSPVGAFGGLTASNSVSFGEIIVSNSSTSTPLVINMQTQNVDIGIVYQRCKMSAIGSWIVIATGTGAADQTIDFSSVMGGAIDWPSTVWVETGDTRHIQLSPGGTPGWFMPFFNCGSGDGLGTSPNYDLAAINVLTEFAGNLEHGPVFKYDASTKVATFGKGGSTASSLGGAVIPNGARVLHQNIHFTSGVFDVVQGNRNQVTAAAGATLYFDCVSFSRNWYFGPSFATCGDATLRNFTVGCRFYVANNYGTLTLFNVAVSPEVAMVPASAPTAFNVTASVGPVDANFIWACAKTAATYAPSLQFSSTKQLRSLGTCWSWLSSTVTGCYPFIFDSVINTAEAPILVGPIYVIGGQFQLYRVDNFHFLEVNHSDQTRGVAVTTSNYGSGNAYAKNVTVAKFRKLPTGVAPRIYLFSYDAACVQCAMKDVVYDAQGNSQASGLLAGERVYVANVTVDNPRSTLNIAGNGIRDTRYANLRSNTLLTSTSLSVGGYFEWAVNNAAGYINAIISDVNPFTPLWTNTARTAGQLYFAPFVMDNLTEHVAVNAGTFGVDLFVQGNTLFLPGSGVEIVYTNSDPIRGVLNFTGAAWTTGSVSMSSGATIEVALRKVDDVSAWGSWFDPSVSANWQTALAAIPGYDSNLGFFIRLRIKTTTAVATRYLSYARLTCTPDSAWVPAEIGYVPVDVTGMVVGTAIKLYDMRSGSPVRVKHNVAAASSLRFDMPYDFDALPRAFRLKLRKPGHLEIVADSYSYQRGTSVPVSQRQIVAVDEVAAAAITTISIDGAAATASISWHTTLAQMYAYAQWWSAQPANMDYPVPLTTTDGVNYSSPYSWTVASGAQLTGAGSVSLGAGALTLNAESTSAFDWSYSSNKRWTRISVDGLLAGSRVQLWDVNGAAELLNAVAASSAVALELEWATNKPIRLRVARCVGTSASLPITLLGTLTSNGASFTVAQAADAVYQALAIDGSTCTEFAPDYPNLQIDVSDSDNITTVQRIYAWSAWAQSTAQGIALMFGAVTAQDPVNFAIDVGVVNTKLDNTKGTPIIIGGGYLVRSDGSTIIAATSGSIQMDPSRAYLVRLSASGSPIAQTVWVSA